ncbi:ABC transporter permease subunit [Nocardioides rubriscoriae]|uniref:ABC transporter permease subunit n=1 Tax=Nocardioides rubriscoriae TaxID=642762 RepID=UPI0011DF65BF|nr:ABC transporter permease subunit [Nocardioides rubriscoriae]
MTTTDDHQTSAPTGAGQLPRTIDVTDDQRVPFARLVAVETRKSFDTRAGRWLTISIVGLVLVVVGVGVFAFPDDAQDYVSLLGVTGGVLGYFLPILMIMLVTSEWSQRTGLNTFTLEPRRTRVIGAKITAGLGLAVVVLALGAAIAAVGVLLSPANGGEAVWNLGYNEVQNFSLSSLIGVLVGFALAMLLRSSPVAIVVYFVYTFILPGVVAALGALVDGFDKVAPWIEFNTAQTPLFTGDYRATGEEWAQIAVTGLIWLVVPFVLGLWRLVRAEVK